MAKNKPLDDLTILNTAARLEGLSYGKYMAKYNYDPPCFRNPGILEKIEAALNRAGEKAESLSPVAEAWQKKCPVCGKYFPGTKRVYCSEACVAINTARREKARRLEGKQQRYCAVCGKPIPLNLSVRVVTCSKACSATKAVEQAKIRNRKRREANKTEKGD